MRLTDIEKGIQRTQTLAGRSTFFSLFEHIFRVSEYLIIVSATAINLNTVY